MYLQAYLFPRRLSMTALQAIRTSSEDMLGLNHVPELDWMLVARKFNILVYESFLKTHTFIGIVKMLF